uniref:Putative Phosphonate ABC transporter, periplasmic phosphonate-binding protein n=1 Tax=Magnetococcus massalia (strain MO-1) TaxID=451514 RepID=A0A1S7LPV9_MAGMO|nr:putative Phosphonate ABC transporter, periplasmic phosphonate-binding protein [Candidatus Magnetococcus massalia]
MSRVLFFAWIGLSMLGLTSVAQAAAKTPLLLAVHPYLNRDELLSRYQPLADYLSRAIDQPVAVRIGTNYQDHLHHVAQDKVDIAFIGPAIYVDMRQKYGVKQLLARFEVHGKPTFQGRIVAQQNGEIQEISDLKGKLFAFGDPKSTMSHLVPRYLLYQSGITVNNMAGHAFLGSHHNVAMAVMAGDFDAGAVKDEVYQTFKKRGLRLIASTQPIPEHLFIARKGLPKPLVKKLRKALLEITQHRSGKRILSGLKKGLTNLVDVQEEDYDDLDHLLQILTQIGAR